MLFYKRLHSYSVRNIKIFQLNESQAAQEVLQPAAASCENNQKGLYKLYIKLNMFAQNILNFLE